MSTQAIEFPYSECRAYNAILWLLHQHGGMLNRLKLMKLVFFADRAHLVRYGRPIVGGRYVAMQHGPVASMLYDEIKQPPSTAPFTSEGYDVMAQRPTDEDFLSESDLEILHEVDCQYGAMDQYSLRNLTHTFESWKKNYHGGQTSYELPYEDFFLDAPERQDMLDVIRDDQEAWALLQ